MRTPKQYIPYVGILALVIFATVAVFYQTLVDENFQRISLKSFLTNPGHFFGRAKKSTPNFHFVPLTNHTNSGRIEKVCLNNECFILLRQSETSISMDEIQIDAPKNSSPIHLNDPETGLPLGWIIPAISANEPGEIAPELGSIVWDEQRSIIVYEVFPQEESMTKRKVIVWDYTKDWSFGSLQRVTLNLPDERIFWTDYDQKNGYLQFQHIDNQTGEQNRLSQLSATSPILYSN